MDNNRETTTYFVVIRMVDTIHFLIKDFEVMENAAVTINPGSINNRTGKRCQRILYKPVSSWKCKPVMGEKAFYSGHIVKADIFTVKYQSKSMMTVRISAPKCLRADNFSLVGGQDLPEVYHRIDEELRSAGIFCDIAGSKVKRLDLARNIITPETPRDYLKVLRFIEGGGLKRKKWNTTLSFQNNQQEICLYDKIAELKSKNRDTSGYPENVLRIEQRLKNVKKIESSLGIVTGQDLIDLYSQCKPWYLKNLEQIIFYLNPADISPGGPIDLMETMELYKQQNYSRSWFNNFIYHQGIESLISQYPGKEICQNLRAIELKGIENPAEKDLKRINAKVARLRADIKKSQGFSLMRSKNRDSGKTNTQLYNELKDLALCV